MARVCIWLVGVFLVPTLGFGQAPPQMPPRDPTQPAKAAGTAIIRGHVLAADSGQPLRKAQVRIVSGELRENRLATTDGDGKYEFKEVVAGRYNVSATKGSYVSLQYGQQRPFEPGKPLEILAAQTLEKVDFSLPRGAVITGRVLDEFGEPLPDAMVSVQRYQNIGGQRRLVPAGRMGTTNDIGEYRIFAIPPGQYYLSATLRPMGMMGDSDDRTGYAATYFPGTANIAESQRITVGLGQALSDMNMSLLPTRTSRVSGTAVDSQGRPMAGMVMAMPRGDSVMMMGFGPPAQIKPDGSFVVSGLTPGRYMLQVRGGFADGESAYADVTVSGDDVTGVRLTASKPSLVTGRVLVDPAAAQTLRLSSLRLGLQPVQMDMFMMGGTPPGAVADDLTFELKAQPGKFRVMLVGQLPGWSIRTVRYRDADVTDGIEFRPGEDIAGIEIELTNKVTDVSGVVTNAKGQPITDYSIVVFPQDRSKWLPNGRYLRTGRPDQDGRFKVSGLPPGTYHIIALDYLDTSGDWSDPESLDRLQLKSASFSVNEGETKTIDLKVTSGS